MPDERYIAIGGPMKAVMQDDQATIEGYLIYFTDETEPDLYKEYFDAETDYVNPASKLIGSPVMYHHGLDKVIGVRDIGAFSQSIEDKVGLWVQAQLDMHDEYQREIFKLAQKGVLSWSSGALPQSVEVEANGHIKRWKVIEGSLTPTPAMPIRTVISAKSYEVLLKGGTDHEEQTQGLKADINIPLTDLPPEKDINMPEEMMAILKQILAAVSQDQQMDTAEQDTAMAAMTKEPMTPDDTTVAVDPNADQVKKAIVLQRLINAGVKAVNDRRATQQNAITSALSVIKTANSQQFPASRTVHVGAVTPSQTNDKGFLGGLGVSENLKYAHLTDLDMAIAYKLAIASTPLGPRGMDGKRPTDFVSQDFYTHAMQKAVHGFERNPLSRGYEHLEVKSMMPYRANELDASDITGQGAEWLSVYYDSQVWEKARNIYIYKMMQSRGMLEKAVPQGFTSAKIPVEGTDPVVYGGTEANSVGPDGRPEMVYKITPFGTIEVDVVPGIFRSAVSYTRILTEDSLVNIAQQANYQIGLAMEENIERVMLNGDTATAINTNINYINGTPTSTGLTKDAYLEFNGLLKSPLVTSTAYSLDALGAFSIETYLSLLSKLPSAQAARTNRLMYVVDFATRQATLKFPDLKTKDVAGDGFTIFTGTIPSLWDIPLYMTGFMDLANNAGKVPLTAGVSTGTLGRILLIDAFYWAFTYKRNITIETERNPSSETDTIYASMRFSLTRRSASAAAAAYNVLV